MERWSPREGDLADFLKDIPLALEEGNDLVLIIALHVNRNAHSPAFPISEVHSVDATLATIKMDSTKNWDFTARVKIGNHCWYAFRAEILLQVSLHCLARL